MDQWQDALRDVIEEDTPYDPSTYPQYLEWYVPRTRTCHLCVTNPPAMAEPATLDLYPAQPGVALHIVVRNTTSMYLSSIVLTFSF